MPPIQSPGRASVAGSRAGSELSPLAGPGGSYRPPPRRRDNLFLWTVFLLLLVAFCMACWIVVPYIFNHPEQPFAYKILTKLKKVRPPQRFNVNAAPQGEFISAEKLLTRLNAMTTPELRDFNLDLFRHYLHNFYPVGRTVIPYLTGRYNIIESYQLQPNDLFTSGVVALAVSQETPKVLIEHVFTAPPETAPLIKRNLPMGMDLELLRTFYLSAVINAEKLPDGRMLLTVVPLNYGSYGIKGSSSGFNLEPPTTLHLAAGLPIINNKDNRRDEAMRAYLAFRQKNGLSPLFGSKRPRAFSESSSGGPAPSGGNSPARPPTVALTGIDKPPPSTEDDFAIERTPPTDTAVATPTPQGRRGRRGSSSPAATPPAPPSRVAATNPDPLPNQSVAKALPVNQPWTGTGRNAPSPPPPAPPQGTPVAAATPPAALKGVPNPSPASTGGGVPVQPILADGASSSPAAGQPPPAPTAAARPSPAVVASASPTPPAARPTTSPTVASTSTSSNRPGGWQVYPPGKAPAGRQLKISDVASLGDRPAADREPLYLNGRFVVSVVMSNPDTGDSGAVLRPPDNPSVRIIAKYPPGHVLPTEGAQVERDEKRPYQITDVRKGADGQLNVWVREITEP